MLGISNLIVMLIGWAVVAVLILHAILTLINKLFGCLSRAYCRHKDKLCIEQEMKIRDMAYEILTMKDVHSSEMNEMRRYADEANVLMDRAVKHYCPNGIPLASISSGKGFDAIMHDIWAFREKAMGSEEHKDVKPSDGMK